MAGSPLDDAFTEAARWRGQARRQDDAAHAARVIRARDWLNRYWSILRELPHYVPDLRNRPTEDVLLIWHADSQVPAALQPDGSVMAGSARLLYGRCHAWRFQYHRDKGQYQNVFIAADRSALFKAEWGFHTRVTRKPWGWKQLHRDLHRLGSWAEPVSSTHAGDLVSDDHCMRFADGATLSAPWSNGFIGLPSPEVLARIIAGLEPTL